MGIHVHVLSFILSLSKKSIDRVHTDIGKVIEITYLPNQTCPLSETWLMYHLTVD